MSDDSPGDAARVEAARQSVILVFTAAGMVAAIVAQRALHDPDAGRRLRMRLAKKHERAMALLAKWAWHEAEQARLAYEQESA